ncbi:MAG: hypothetical protein PHE83_18625 [Opitutaceae bacterium]|nr:hypothetical protein [Opitutaceae bacterium]
MSLDELIKALRAKLGDQPANVTQVEYTDGSSKAKVLVSGSIVATFKGRLVKMPPPDRVTPRGPKEYFDLVFTT